MDSKYKKEQEYVFNVLNITVNALKNVPQISKKISLNLNVWKLYRTKFQIC